VLLSIYYTAARLRKRVAEFLRPYGLTDVQFNLLMILQHQSGSNSGLSQAQISTMMLVNRADITSLIDRMEKAGLVARTAHSNDRRFNIIKPTGKGEKLFAKVESSYLEQVHKSMSSLNESELKKLMTMLEKVRETLRT
jgi:MarR family 2-MHQ and catechol resistance regulon transcriptional repressor